MPSAISNNKQHEINDYLGYRLCFLALLISCIFIEAVSAKSLLVAYLYYGSLTAMAFFLGRLFYCNNSKRFFEASICNLLVLYFLLYYFRLFAQTIVGHEFSNVSYVGSFLLVFAICITLLRLIFQRNTILSLIILTILAFLIKEIPFFNDNLLPRQVLWLSIPLLLGFCVEKIAAFSKGFLIIRAGTVIGITGLIGLSLFYNISERFAGLTSMKRLMKTSFFGRTMLLQSYLCGIFFIVLVVCVTKWLRGSRKGSFVFSEIIFVRTIYEWACAWNHHWVSSEKRYRRWSYLGVYSIAFLVIASGVFFAFIRYNKSMVWYPDGIAGYYGNLMYLGVKGKAYLHNLLSTGALGYSGFDFTISLGRDVAQRYISSLVNPIQILALFCPLGKMEYLYVFGIVTRYYLTGISFSLYAKRFSQTPAALLVASFAYTFCGYAVYAGIRHPHFQGMMCVFPLLLLAIDEVIEKKSVYKLILAVFFGAMLAIYTFYIMSVVAVLYAFVRFFSVYQKRRFKEFCIAFSKCVFAYGMGLLMSAVTWLPSMLVYQASGRIGKTDTLSLASLISYDWNYYRDLVNYFVIGKSTIGNWTCVGFSVLVLPAALHLFRKRDHNRDWAKNLFVLFVALLCIPVFAYAASGFNSLYNRWCFALALPVAVLIMYHLDTVTEMDMKSIRLLICAPLLLALSIFVNYKQFLTTNALWSVFLLVICFFCLYGIFNRSRRPMWRTLYVITAVVSIIVNANEVYSPLSENYSSEFSELGKAEEYYTNTAMADIAEYLEEHPDQGFYRTTSDDIALSTDNSAVYWGLYGLSDFNSAERLINDYLIDTESSGIFDSTIRLGMDGRTFPMELASVKYFAVKSKDFHRIPYGYRIVKSVNQQTDELTDESSEIIEDIQEEQERYYILENTKALSLGYIYRSYFTRDEYENMNAVEKQEAMMQGALLETEVDYLDKTNFNSTAYRIGIRDIKANDIIVKKNSITVEPGGNLELDLEELPENCELYVRLVGMDAAKSNDTLRWKAIAEVGDTQIVSELTSSSNVYSTQTEGRILNLGYYLRAPRSVKMYFSAGKYKLKDIEIWAQPMDDYDSWVNALKEDELTDLQIAGNEISAKISASQEELLCLGIPYSSVAGWTLYIDGVKSDILQVNTIYMGTQLTAGDHEIRLVYYSPKVRLCALISGAGWGLFGVFMILGHFLGKRKKEQV